MPVLLLLKFHQQYYSADAKNKKTATRVMYKSDSPAFVLPGGFGDNS